MELVEFKKDKIDRFAHSNKLIEARYQLTLPEQRLVLTMVAMVTPNDADFKEYKIDIREFAGFFGIKGDSIIANVKKAAKSLIEKAIIIKDEQKTLYLNWISSAEFPEGKSYVALCFDPKLKPYLLHLKEQYTFLENKHLVNLRSVYSIRIYMLLKQYLKFGKRTFEIDTLREMLGIKPSEYPRLYDLKVNVLSKAEVDINGKTDLQVSYVDGKKKGKKVLEIIFTINEKKGIEGNNNKDQEEEKDSDTSEVGSSVGKKEGKASKKVDPEYLQSQFEKFWVLYPKKQAKENARKAFIKLMSENPEVFDLIINGLKNYNSHIAEQITKNSDWDFVALPTTWLNGKRFYDEYSIKKENRETARKVDNDQKAAIKGLAVKIKNSFEFKQFPEKYNWDDFKDLNFKYVIGNRYLVECNSEIADKLKSKYSDILEKHNIELSLNN